MKNQQNLQQQIDERCPCFAKPLSECDCKSEVGINMTVHKLKTWTEYFQAINRGDKTFELRLNDRDFQNGDILLLQEWNEDTGFTGNEITVVVTYLLEGRIFGLEEGFVIMSFQRIDAHG